MYMTTEIHALVYLLIAVFSGIKAPYVALAGPKTKSY